MLELLLSEPYKRIWLAGLVLVLGYLITKFVTDVLKSFLSKKEILDMLKALSMDENVVELLISGLKYLLYIVTILLAINQLGVSLFILEVVMYLIIILLFIIIVLSLKSFVINAAAGISLVKNKHIRKGDKIKVNGYEGVVDNINLMNVVLKEKNGRVVIIPNSKLNDKIITKLK